MACCGLPSNDFFFVATRTSRTAQPQPASRVTLTFLLWDVLKNTSTRQTFAVRSEWLVQKLHHCFYGVPTDVRRQQFSIFPHDLEVFGFAFLAGTNRIRPKLDCFETFKPEMLNGRSERISSARCGGCSMKWKPSGRRIRWMGGSRCWSKQFLAWLFCRNISLQFTLLIR